MDLPSERGSWGPAHLDPSALAEECGPSLRGTYRAAIRIRHLSCSTERASASWIRHYLRFHGNGHPLAMVKPEVELFLRHLAVEGRVTGSTQRQALAALLFPYGAGLRLLECAPLRVKGVDFAVGHLALRDAEEDNLEDLRALDETRKLRMIEKGFHRLMFGSKGV